VKLLDVAIKYIGTQEDAAHTNHGAQVTKWEMEAGLPSGGYAWCQSFVYGCGDEAYGPANPVPKTAGVMACWNMAVASPTLDTISKEDATAENILPGFQGILNLGHGEGHTFVVESVDADGTLHTIEGNSNEDGGRDGFEVCRHSKRHLTDAVLVGFICYADPA